MSHHALSPEQLLSTTARALSGNPQLQVSLRSNAPKAFALGQDTTLSTAIIADIPDAAASLRGGIDGWALAQQHHDPALHRRMRPRGQEHGAAFDALEAMRVWLVGSKHLAGVRSNLHHHLQQHCLLQDFAQQPPSAKPPLPELLAVLLHQEITGGAAPAAIAEIVMYWRPYIYALARAQIITLTAKLDDQEQFALRSRELLHALTAEIGSGAGQSAGAETESDQLPAHADTLQQDDHEDAGLGEPSLDESDALEHADPLTSSEPLLMPGAGEEPDMGGGDEGDIASTQARELPEVNPFAQAQAVPAYHAFTTQFDEVVHAHQLISAEELMRLRGKLDEKLSQVRGTFAKLSARLQRVLLAKQQRKWEFDLEDGRIHPARLARLVASPRHNLIYREERDTAFRDTVVTLLLDNSGSMRGRPITIAALSADILSRTLERAGIKVEILGFTTAEWKGGRAGKAWKQAGSPAHAGRLNDLRHIIYKSADTPLVRAKRNLGLMLKDGILKENIDGEALLWAYGRLLARRESRRILMIISDGAPVDDSTLSANDSAYLDRHLRDVIRQIESDERIELLAIGIGHDVGRYYSRSVTLRDVAKLGETMTNELVSLFEK
jgi:cobaltochelatase CobT